VVITATCARDSSSRRKALQSVKIVQLDIGSQESVDKAVETLRPPPCSFPTWHGLDYLVNNAGKNPQPNASFEELYVLVLHSSSVTLLMALDTSDLAEFADEITFSSVAPLRVSRAFLPLINKSEIKKIIFISSVLASSQITSMMAGQFNAYSMLSLTCTFAVTISFCEMLLTIFCNSAGSLTSGLLPSSTRASAPPLSTLVRIYAALHMVS
jgi:NAD(P)-dependent dehydrogenase (short-subunit alcohol dehydrogenase family)